MIIKNSFPKIGLAVGLVTISAIVLSGCTTTSVANRLKSLLGQAPAAEATMSPEPSAQPVGSALPNSPSSIRSDETSTPKPTTTGNTDVDKAVIDMDASFNKAKTTDTTGAELSF
jgi:hypothetical protein